MAPTPVQVWQHGSKLFDKLRSYYVKHAGMSEHPRTVNSQLAKLHYEYQIADNMFSFLKDPTPLISPRTALFCAILYTVAYVAPFYLSPTLRSTPLQSRDAPTVIKARVRSVALTCLFCTIITVYVLAIYGHATPPDVARLLGLWPVDFLDIVRTLSLVLVLFVGPLYESIIVDGDWRELSLATIKDRLFDDWRGYRNLVIAPASEELVFRSLTISVYLLAKVSPTRIVFTTPLIFGMAHIHHLVEFLQSRTPQGQMSPPAKVWIAGIVRSLFQFTYTSLFGFFAAFVFLRTGSLWAAIAVHSFCNWMGVPRVSGRVGQFADSYEMHITTDVAQGKRDDDDQGSPVKVGNSLMEGQDEESEKAAAQVFRNRPKNLGIEWTIVYYGLILVGSFGFYKLLSPLTESSNALATF